MSNESIHEIWFQRDGVRLFAVGAGEGTPVILLHGGLADHRACLRFAAPLASRARIITPDLRAAGRSIHRGPLSWDQLADDVAALLDHLDLPRAVIGGVSFGSGVAVRVALRHPARVSALILLSPAFAGADVGLTAAQQAAMRAMDAAGRRAIAEGVQVLYPLLDGLPEPSRSRARAMVDEFDPESVAATTAFMASGAQPLDRAADLAAVEAPTLLVPGTDPYHPPEVAETYCQHLPRCTVCTIDGDDYPLVDYGPAIAAFLDHPLG